MQLIRLCFILILCGFVLSQRTALDSAFNLQIYRKFRNWIVEYFGTGEEGRRLSAVNRQTLQEEIPSNVHFPCNVTGGRSPKIPTSVNRLRPGDVDVIAAMGDSLTAGAGILATNLLQIGVENRGLSASSGGQGTWRTYLTLPNILKEFNPRLIGYAVGDSLSNHPAAQLNVAETGAMSRDMPFMAKYLVNKIKRDSRIDIKKHWKLISLMIGSNDFCSEMCSVPSPWTIVENHKINLVRTLRILRDNLPRTLIALHVTPHLSALVNTREKMHSFRCYAMTTIECPCLLTLQFRDRQAEYYDVMTRWQNVEQEIADYPEFHRNDFTVVALPVLKHTMIPLAVDGLSDESFLSYDCFHISQKGNAWYANGIWNNLLEPYGNKTQSWDKPYKRFLCPTAERPFLMTRENSWRIVKRS